MVARLDGIEEVESSSLFRSTTTKVAFDNFLCYTFLRVYPVSFGVHQDSLVDFQVSLGRNDNLGIYPAFPSTVWCRVSAGKQGGR